MRYFIGFLITLGLIIVLIVLLFGGGGSKKPAVVSKTLPSYADSDAQAVLTIQGPINANQLHQQVRITVGRDAVTFDSITGYEGQVVSSQSFINNQSAYSAFLHALNVAGFTRGDKSKALANESGYCPLGNRYVFEFRQDDQDLQRYWSTSCGNPKTYRGNTSLTLTLFQAQVPNYSTLTQDLSL